MTKMSSQAPTVTPKLPIVVYNYFPIFLFAILLFIFLVSLFLYVILDDRRKKKKLVGLNFNAQKLNC